MERQKRWQFFLIIAVILLTIYNILPTVFFYSKPLKNSIDEKRANQIALSIVDRVNRLENEAIAWLHSFCGELKIKPLSIHSDAQHPELITLSFKTTADVTKFREYLPRAGSLIPFVPAQISLYESAQEEISKNVTVQRRIPIHFDPEQLNAFFQFSPKKDQAGNVTDLYRALINDRIIELGIALGGMSENAGSLQAIVKNPQASQNQELLLSLAQNILSYTKIFGENSALSQRYYSSFTQLETESRSHLIQSFIVAFDQIKDKIRLERISLEEESKNKREESSFLETAKQQRLELLQNREKTLTSAEQIIKNHTAAFASGKNPLNYTTLGASLQESELNAAPSSKIQTLSLKDRNPFIDQLIIDWGNEKIILHLHPDFLGFKKHLEENLSKVKNSLKEDQADQFLYDEIAAAARLSGEVITPYQEQFEISLNQLQDSESFLAMRLSKIAEAEIQQIREALLTTWAPAHPDFSREAFPILDYETYSNLPQEMQKLGLILYAPSVYNKMPPKGFRMNSIYVIAKGMDKILQKIQSSSEEQSEQFIADFNSLRKLLQKAGFLGYSGSAYALSSEFASDFIFEAEDYFQTILKASRENFAVHGTRRFAVLEFTDVEQRILVENKIGNRMHEDLLKWRDDYHAAQLKIKGTHPFDVPPPTKNVLWDNFKLSFVKYFRGDDRKILHWGLDLSGGKTVQIELRDSHNRVVTEEADIKEAINELYKRVNKMGVSEVSIRQEGNTITLDFPGSQSLSASELVKASSMYFHVVNEKFGPNHSQLAETVDKFLQEIWNEAVVTNHKNIEDINAIGWRHLYGDTSGGESIQPRSEAARILYENGLRFASPQDMSHSHSFNDSTSKIGIFRGSDFTDWHGQTHPLLILFSNFALEGANLENVHASYDSSKGNFLSFEVQGSQTTKSGERFNPRDSLSAWSSHFSREKILGTPYEAYSQGKGWRMAVILNGSIISAPTLDSPLRDSAMITGSFTQREVSQLEADLKAGSLSFTPHILSEKNVSPELGAHERNLGILATVIALSLVIFTMMGYYRFGGVIACMAVFFNLLIMWATLQNLQATLTLASIAGIILTLGMAVDANVLVFERIREEFAVSGRIASAIHSGYKKAFSAIIDSNLTTIIAALILLHFDSGPIKGFAVTLIIGIISSLFTALFVTRYFFAGWVQNPHNKSLKMLNFIKTRHFNFLKHTKITLILSTVIILAGGCALIAQRHHMFGMDFTGGYALSLELKELPGDNYRAKVEQALLDQGASSQEFQVRELTPSNHIRIFLSKNLNQSGRPFYGMPLRTDLKELTYSYESNPKIVWIVQALEKEHLSLDPHTLQHLDTNWTEISGQISQSMRNSALIGLLLALICIMIYITFRFEFKYAISATLCLAHDIIFTVAVMALLHAVGVPIQIDLITIAALMTIVGYSLNDTIIVFDRIREDIRHMRKSSLSEILNHALNVTLSRTLMTSGTTLLVLLPLVALGGSTIFGFALVMIIGVIFGTLSSLFIAAPLMHYFHQRETRKKEQLLLD